MLTIFPFFLKHLDQILSLELFQAFLTSYHSLFAELGKKLAKEKERHKLLCQVQKYYMSERRHLLRCIKHLFGYWQDSSHPYRVRGNVGITTNRTKVLIG